MRSWLPLFLAAAVTLGSPACGGSSGAKPQNAKKRGDKSKVDEPGHVSAAKAAEHPPDKPTPVEVDFKLVRLGNSVRLDISGVGRHRPAKHAMERPDNWIVHLLADKQLMPRTVNGSVKVERFEVGNPANKLWDIEVGFSMAYAIPSDAEELTIRITAPESPMFERTVSTSEIETKKSKLDEERERAAERARIKAEERAKRRKARREKRKRERREKRKREQQKQQKSGD